MECGRLACRWLPYLCDGKDEMYDGHRLEPYAWRWDTGGMRVWNVVYRHSYRL